MVRQFSVVATGGTFDLIHAGHVALLSKAFELGEHVIIGVSSDEFARRRGKRLVNVFETRQANLRKIIREKFGDVHFELSKLEGDFGPAVTTRKVDALIASTETETKIERLNELRRDKGLTPTVVVAIDLVKAQDGRPISSTRIRDGEIDTDGRLIEKKTADPQN